MPAVGAGSARPNCLMSKDLMCSYSFKLHVSHFRHCFKHKGRTQRFAPTALNVIHYTLNTKHFSQQKKGAPFRAHLW